jgi:hypothetical protein
MTVPTATPDSMMEDSQDHHHRVVVEEELEGERSLCVPITSSSKAVERGLFVEIFPDELAQTPASTLMQVLRDEKADVRLWADAALLYMQQKNAKDSLAILEEANQLYTDEKEKKVRVLAAAGIAHLAATAAQHQGGPAGAFLASFFSRVCGDIS